MKCINFISLSIFRVCPLFNIKTNQQMSQICILTIKKLEEFHPALEIYIFTNLEDVSLNRKYTLVKNKLFMLTESIHLISKGSIHFCFQVSHKFPGIKIYCNMHII